MAEDPHEGGEVVDAWDMGCVWNGTMLTEIVAKKEKRQQV